MACCMVALAMVYRLIDAWQRLRAGWARSRELASGLAAQAAGIWRPAALAALFAFNLGLLGTLAWLHREHLAQAGAATEVALRALCRNGVTLASEFPRTLSRTPEG